MFDFRKNASNESHNAILQRKVTGLWFFGIFGWLAAGALALSKI